MSSSDARTASSRRDGADVPLSGPEIVLEVRGLVKEFPGTRALDDVDLAVRRGEVHALLGENGAGKSTLIRVICGASRPTAGAIFVGGQLVEFASPQQAQALGIAVVHQHFNLATQLSVAENLFLSRSLPRRAGIFVNWSETRRQAEKLLARVGLNIDPMTEVSQLRPDESAMVAIAKAIGSDAKIIILDEPTSALLPAEVSILFGHMRRLASEGHSFLYVSHRLAGVFEIAGRGTVCRVGRSSRRSSAQASPGSRTPPPRSPLLARRSWSQKTLPAVGSKAFPSNCARAKSSGSPACPEAAPRKRWTCCSPAIPFGAGS